MRIPAAAVTESWLPIAYSVKKSGLSPAAAAASVIVNEWPSSVDGTW